MLENDQSAALYNKQLLSYVQDFPAEDRLETPDATASDVSPVCGSEVVIDLTLNQSKICKIGHKVEACALTKTVLAIFLKTAPGLDAKGIEQGHLMFLDWLEEKRDSLDAPWQELQVMAPARSYTARHNSMCLPFTATLKALKKLDKSP